MAKPYGVGPVRRVVNLTATTLLHLGIGGKSTYLLTTTGRGTGQKRTTPVTLVETDAEGGWCHHMERWPGCTTCEPSRR